MMRKQLLRTPSFVLVGAVFVVSFLVPVMTVPEHDKPLGVMPYAASWAGGSVVASVRSSEDGGSVEVTDGEGRSLRTWP